MDSLESQKLKHTKGIFFEGQLFDAYVFANDLIKNAKDSIILIDNYVDETTLLMLSKRNPECNAIIYTQKITEQLQLDLAKHNAQYPSIEIKMLKMAHDRFLILDQKELYHIGASLKDLGKKWFAFSKLNEFLPEILKKLDKNLPNLLPNSSHCLLKSNPEKSDLNHSWRWLWVHSHSRIRKMGYLNC